MADLLLRVVLLQVQLGRDCTASFRSLLQLAGVRKVQLAAIGAAPGEPVTKRSLS